MAIEKLSTDAREAALGRLPDWRHEPGRDAIVRSFKFADFSQAFAFMTRIALLAERADHHPEWSNVYNRVEVLLTTHEANGLSQRDVDIALAIDALI